MGAGFVERIARAQIHRVGNGLRDRRYRARGEMGGQAPGRAHERGAVDADGVAAGCAVRADIARERAALELAPDLLERAHATPTIRHTADLLPELSLQVPWAPHAVCEARACGVRIAAVISGVHGPLDAFKCKCSFDNALPRQRSNGGYWTMLRRSGRPKRRSRADVDDLGPGQPAEAKSEHLDLRALRAEKVDVTFTRNRHEAP